MPKHAETVSDSHEQPLVPTGPEPPPPASRQSLVVKPRSSNGPLLVLGAVASAAAGFAIVFVSGLGRSNQDAVVPEMQVVAHAPRGSASEVHAPKADAARPIQPPQKAALPQEPPRFLSPAMDERMGDVEPAPIDERRQSRFAATPVALEDPAGEDGATEAASQGRSPSFSRFSEVAPEADSVDASEETTPLLVPPDGGEGESVTSQETTADADDSPFVERGADVGSPIAAATAEPTRPPEPAAPSGPTPQASAPRVPPQPATPPPLRSPPLESTLAAALAPMQPPASRPPVAAASSPFEDPAAPIPVTPPGGGQAGPPEVRTSPDLARAERPQQDRIASTDVTRGFGGAPVVTAPPTALGPSSPATGRPAGDGLAGPLSDTAGGGTFQADGKPGPIQLEGVQTPQLTIEKRGPREVQVGKVARYDMVVRNVGGVSAHDVTLRDRVPLGTKLVSTSPPAAPGEAGDLVWTLGSLPQGGQARVAMEVMPVEEGEVGSVASVSFRADASVRSVATRAGLVIEAESPKAVLVGSAIELGITVRNPGTGEATGVVLEGNVPSGFTHASGPALEYDVGRLRPGEARRIDLKLVSTHPGVQALKFSARADGRIEAEHAVRLEVTAPTLELTASMPSRRYLQRPVTCVLSMNNAGTAPANTIELAAQLPPGMKFLRSNNAGYYEESTHRVLWHLEQLPAAEVGTVEMVLVPTALGPQRIAAAARSADGLAAQAFHTVEVEGLAALLFEVGDSEDPIEVDGITEYVVRVGNQGTKAATGVRVSATLLGDLEPVDAKGPAAHRIENLSIQFEPLANLAPAQESVYRIRVRGRREGDQRVQVQVTSDDSQSPITKEEVTRVYADR